MFNATTIQQFNGAPFSTHSMTDETADSLPGTGENQKAEEQDTGEQKAEAATDRACRCFEIAADVVNGRAEHPGLRFSALSF